MSSEKKVISIKKVFNLFNPKQKGRMAFFLIWSALQFPLLGTAQNILKQVPDHPSLWKGKNIGGGKTSGSFSGYDEGSWFNYTLKGLGSNIGSTEDSFFYMYREYSGDFTIETPLNSLTGGQAGLMVRSGLEPNSANISLLVRDDEAALQWRTKTGEDTRRTTQKTTLPGFLKIIRAGNTFHAYLSEDNKNWYRIGNSQPLNLGDPVYIGLAVSAKETKGDALGIFAGVSVKPASKLPGKPKERDKSQDWQNKGIGIADGNVTMAKGGLLESYTITASGNPGTDRHHFMYKAFSGDFTFQAQLTSILSGDAGLMIRENLSEGSKRLAVLIKNAEAIFLSGNESGVVAHGNIKNAGPSPYIKLVRAGNVFHAFLLSNDGKKWHRIGASLNIGFDKKVFIGLATATGNEKKSNKAVFTNLAVSNEAVLPGTASPSPRFKLNPDYRTTINLNGEWDLQEANGDVKPVHYTRTVPVPGITTMAHPAYAERLHMNRISTRQLGDETIADEMVTSPFKYFWYKKTFLVDATTPKERVVIKIRAKYNAQVYLNGILLGYDKHSTYSHGEFDATKAIRYGKENVLEARIGCNETATFSSIMTVSNHYRSSRAPGIWDDVLIEFSQAQSIKEMLISPDIYKKTATAKLEIENKETIKRNVTLLAQVVDVNGKAVSATIEKKLVVLPGSNQTAVSVPCRDVVNWMGGKYGNPALYQLQVQLITGNKKSDAIRETFGFRNIEISGRDFKINGKKVYFHNENIVFERALLDWAPLLFDEKFARKFLTTIKNEYNIDLLRFHVGHAPSMWYRLADETGVMIFDEWKYFHENDPRPGTETEDNTIEYQRWVKQNMNHASIIGWDNQNEGHSEVEDIIQKCRAIDSTRPWVENQDMVSDNRYYYVEIPQEYSGKPALDDKRYELEFPGKPYMIFESIRWWTDNYSGWPERKVHISNAKKWFRDEPYTVGMADTLQRMLFADEGGYYRSAPEVSAWCPFALLSGSENGHTLFDGDLKDLKPRKSLLVLRDLNEHFGATIRMLNAIEWFYDKKNYKKGDLITKPVDVWNHFDTEKKGTVFCRVYDRDQKRILSETSFNVSVPGYGTATENVSFQLPSDAGDYVLKCEIKDDKGNITWSPERYIRVR